MIKARLNSITVSGGTDELLEEYVNVCVHLYALLSNRGYAPEDAESKLHESVSSATKNH